MSSIYKKFGAGAVDFAPLVSGQKAVGESLKDALGSVDKLFNQAKSKIVEQNTLNLEAKLKTQVRSEGLGGTDTFDTTNLRQQYGDRINFEQLEKTFDIERQRLRKDAVDQASLAANRTLAETNDPLKAREILTNTLREMGGKESFVTTASQAWTDSNATRIEDAKVREIQEGNNRFYDVLSESRKPGANQDQIIRAAVQDLSEDRRPFEAKRLKHELNEYQKLSDEEQETVEYHVSRENIRGMRTVQAARDVESDAVARWEAAKNDGVMDSSYDYVDGANKKIGGGVITDVKELVENTIESFWPGLTDTEEVATIKNDLIAEGLNARDAAAITAQVVNEHYDGSGNFKPGQLKSMRDRSRVLQGKLATQVMIGNEVSDARKAVTAAEFDHEENMTKFRRDLITTGQRRNLGVEGAPTIDEAAMSAILEGRKAPTTGSSGDAPGSKPQKDMTTLEQTLAEAKIYEGLGGQQTPSDETPQPLKSVPTPTIAGKPGDPVSNVSRLTPMDDGSQPHNTFGWTTEKGGPSFKGAPEGAPPSDAHKRVLDNLEKRKAANAQIGGPDKPEKIQARHEESKELRKMQGMPVQTVGSQAVKHADGTKSGGSRSWRNNNPGNIKAIVDGKLASFAKRHGATGVDEDGFAVFKNADDGKRAMESLLFKTDSYKNLKLSDAIERYAPKSENNVKAYVNAVLPHVGVEKRMSEYSPQERAAILQAMIRHEGWEEGTSS